MSEHASFTLKKRLLVSALSVIACYIPVHGYRFFHLLASGDGLLQLYQNDAAWEIALGRFVQPFVVLFRGGYTTPFLINLLALCWLCLAVFFTTLYLDLQKTLSVALVAAFFVINRTFVMLNGSYLPWADSYVFALLLSVAGLFLASGHSANRVIAGALCFAASIGLYQAYICVALGLCAMRLILDLAQRAEKKDILQRLTGEGAAFALSAALYLACWKGLQAALNIWSADGYNGMAGIGGTDGAGASGLLQTVYGNVLRYFTDPVRIRVMTFRGMDLGIIWTVLFRVANLCMLGLLVVYLVKLNRRHNTSVSSRVLQAVLFLLSPLCVNLVCLLSGGMQHVLMVYAFQLYYVFVVVLHERKAHAAPGEAQKQEAEKQETGKRLRARVFAALPGCFAFVILWPQVIYANQIYLKKTLQEEAAQTLIVRVIEEIEGMEGYVPGETAVFFAGSLERNPYIADNDLLTDEMPWGTMRTAFTYGGMEAKWLAAFEHMRLRTADALPDGEQADDMPCFPVKGSIRYAGEVLVVRLSE